uniref:Double-stranded RNA-binding protein 2 n=1 Tax=Lygus hesperus TaxID=30085 RepID=A0A0A9Z0Q0_LYGHE
MDINTTRPTLSAPTRPTQSTTLLALGYMQPISSTVYGAHTATVSAHKIHDMVEQNYSSYFARFSSNDDCGTINHVFRDSEACKDSNDNPEGTVTGCTPRLQC